MKNFLPLSIFAIAFAVVEAAVVVYLRQLYYPEGFALPLKPIPTEILHIEMTREAATLLMLISVGIIAGKNRWQKFCYAVYCFGLWDIFYYIWLKLFTGWPESFLTADILFLLPVIWWGPLLAPVTVGLSLCVASMVTIGKMESGWKPLVRAADIFWIVLGAVIILYTFMADASTLEAGGYPPPYRWVAFAIGELVGVTAFVKMILRKV